MGAAFKIRRAALSALALFSARAAAPAAGAPGWPPPPAAPYAQARFAAGAAPKGVILVIGDGMGRGALDFASMAARGAPGRLHMQSLPVSGLCRTGSANSSVTDSAAAGTALACGEKTNNGMVGMSRRGAALMSVARLARGMGKAVGVITSDALHGATPACFFANREMRNMADGIIEDMAGCGFEFIAGNDESVPFVERRRARFTGQGYAVADSVEAVAAAPGNAKILALMPEKEFAGDSRLLARLMSEAVARLSADPDGFFLMVESHYADKGGHDHDPALTLLGVAQADWAAAEGARAALSGGALLIVTADHETGGLRAEAREGAAPRAVFTEAGHTGAPVALHAFGAGAERFSGEQDNTDIPKKIAALWGAALPAGWGG